MLYYLRLMIVFYFQEVTVVFCLTYIYIIFVNLQARNKRMLKLLFVFEIMTNETK